ncbi:MAG: bile acid:sodium symporter [Candidatus Dactylopiibacterium carminicum]|uniref:Bile acid:sodium symporter n=1 Tax=Candidatus Dactylopiibacterium carminicum TaxID=857335 RepID=A0A272EXF0_9RHOO|nr:bile acid:sodium symporter family protein [Candidatus Dactylopiibacterium carminicum]KAF7600203.1 bile acid:sodium symporter [Candidatus Dactylopiibacterium carminicum]PAS94779.1 MAG: bile acid:sodium symporter [Candidatus Dactylopiibacterium carminicum]PAT00201.1 MAG: bile acid:sodium symporter [Candidatus Dactylopiibacterium carminicum]
MLDILKKLARDWFLAGMLLSVIVASFVPDIGRSGGWIHADTLSDYGIFLIFFLHGIGLSTENLRRGISRWKLHVLVQVFTFGVFPLLWWVLNLGVGRWLPQDLMFGFFYLCALPSTISSSVAMTSLARGNVPGAIFNATLSTLLGIFLTPLLVSLLMGQSGQLDLGEAMFNIARLLLLPFVVGQVLRPLWGAWFARYKKYTNVIDRGVILLLVFSAFSDSVADGLWSKHGVWLIVQTLIGAAVILAIVLWLSRFAARRAGFEIEDEIAAVFCGSKKTLASGVPMAKLLFGSQPAIGVIVLPIMFYHQLQLFVCALMARRYAARVDPDA